jgi:hypothetical protein
MSDSWHTGGLFGTGAYAYANGEVPVWDAAQGRFVPGSGGGGGGSPLTEQTTTATGTQHNFDLNSRNIFLRCTGAAPAFSGFTVMGAPPTAGDMVTIECWGTTAKCTYLDGGSSAANQILCPAVGGQIVGVFGRMQLIYDGTSAKWREAVIEPGAWITPTFSAADYTASGGGSWTVGAGDITTLLFQQRGRVLTVAWDISFTSVSGLPVALQRVIPGGLQAASVIYAPSLAAQSGVGTNGKCQVIPGTTIYYYRDLVGTAWADSVELTTIQGSFTFQVT